MLESYRLAVFIDDNFSQTKREAACVTFFKYSKLWWDRFNGSVVRVFANGPGDLGSVASYQRR